MNNIVNIVRSNKVLFKIAEKIIDISRWSKDNTVNRLYWHIYSSKSIKKNKIVICSYYGKGYCDNGKYIVNEILKRRLEKDIVWIVSNENIDNELPKEVRSVKYMSKEMIYEMATAKIWIDNSRKHHYIKKREEQKYIQTWHGGIALKKIEGDTENTLRKNYVKAAKRDSKNIDILISNSRFNSEIYKRAFWYKGDIIECGSPRNDKIITSNIDIVNKVKIALRIDKRKKIIMYAPTFRNNNSIDKYKFNYERCINSFKNRFNDDFVMIIRLHPNILKKSEELGIYLLKDIYNASFYSDMQELLIASDILITDYSSSMFDFMLTKRPCLIYATDKENYKSERGFYFNIDELPFSYSENEDELINNIREFKEDIYEEKLKIFINKIESYDTGNASNCIVDWIEKNI